jgi:hypothetical protein
MNKKNIGKTLIILLALLGGGITTGYILLNKSHVNIATADGLPVSAALIYKAYLLDSASAGKTYNGKVVEISGEVKSMSRNIDGQLILMLKTGTEGGSVNCTMEDKQSAVKAGQYLILKAIVSGMGDADPDLGIPADLYLNRARLVSAKDN